MNELQIVESIFGTDCFTPLLRVEGDKTFLSAKFKLSYVGRFSPISLEWWIYAADKQGYEVGIDFIRKEFTLTKKH